MRAAPGVSGPSSVAPLLSTAPRLMNSAVHQAHYGAHYTLVHINFTCSLCARAWAEPAWAAPEFGGYGSRPETPDKGGSLTPRTLGEQCCSSQVTRLVEEIDGPCASVCPGSLKLGQG